MNEEKIIYKYLKISSIALITGSVMAAMVNAADTPDAEVLDTEQPYENQSSWTDRLEISVGLTEDLEPTISALTVQPLQQDADGRNTIFTQLSHFSYEQFDDRKNTTNLGLGFRNVSDDNSLLIGANIFYDYEWEEGHQRLGFGLEAKMDRLDFTLNFYDAISDEKAIDANVDELALDGYDVTLRTQLPYMPWATLGLQYYEWDSIDFDDIEGTKISLDVNLTENMDLELGLSDDNDSDQTVFANLTYNFGGNSSRPNMSDGYDTEAFVTGSDMRDHNLDKVRRQNKIITERDSTGVTISRKN